jgi:glyoxylase-like metal-dependent hydrolase (beta-lactamase superfamily II)
MLPDGVHALDIEAGEDRTLTPAALETDAGLVLVDVGLPDMADALEDALRDRGLDFEDVASVLLTHQDGDHAGCLAEVAGETGVPVLAHEDAAPFVTGERQPIKAGDDGRYPPAPVDVELVGGERVATEAGPARVIHTPGHAPGHVSLYFPEEQLLLAGDALTAETGDLAGPKPQYTPAPAEAARSVRRLAERRIETVLCFHGGPVAVDPADLDRAAAETAPGPE